MSRSVSAPSSVTNTSPCWNGLIVPGSTFRYGSNFCTWTRRPRAFRRRPSDAATIPLPSAETTPPVTKTYRVGPVLTRAPRRRQLPPGEARLRHRLAPLTARCSPAPCYSHCDLRPRTASDARGTRERHGCHGASWTRPAEPVEGPEHAGALDHHAERAALAGDCEGRKGTDRRQPSRARESPHGLKT